MYSLNNNLLSILSSRCFDLIHAWTELKCRVFKISSGCEALLVFLEKMTFYCLLSSTLRKKCPHSELFYFAFSRILSISPYSVQMRETADQNNSEHGHFSRSAIWIKWHFHWYSYSSISNRSLLSVKAGAFPQITMINHQQKIQSSVLTGNC